MDSAISSERLRSIVELQSEIAATALDLDAVMELVVDRAQQLMGAAASVIEMVDGEEMVYHVASGTARESVGLRLPAASSLSGLCVAKDEVLYCEDAEHDERVDYEASLRVGAVSMLCAPLRHESRVIGVLKVSDGRPRAFDAADVETLSLLSGLIAAHIAHAGEYQDRAHASTHDALTGILNRRSFDERLTAEGARVRRHGGEVMICALDLDRFKAVNDTLGHAAGDEVLRASHVIWRPACAERTPRTASAEMSSPCSSWRFPRTERVRCSSALSRPSARTRSARGWGSLSASRRSPATPAARSRARTPLSMRRSTPAPDRRAGSSDNALGTPARGR